MTKYLSILLLFLFVMNVSAQDTQCPGFAPSRLVVGERGRVTPGDSNNVRDNPTSNATRIGQIPASGIFTVIEGPICADGFAWWQIEYNGLVGWTVEGSGDTYWLEPLPEDTGVQPVENAIVANNLTHLTLRELDFTDLTDFAFSPDNRWGAFIENDGIWTIDYSLPDIGATLVVRLEQWSGSGIEFTDSNLLVYRLGRELIFAQPDTGEVQFSLPVGYSLRGFAIRGDFMVSHQLNGLQIWDIDLRTRTFEWSTNEGITTVAMNRAGTLFAAATGAGFVYVWNTEDGSRIHRLSLYDFGNPGETVYSLAFSPDGLYLAGASSHKVVLWDIATGTRVVTLAGRNQVLYSPDGNLLLTIHPEDVPLDELHRRSDIVVYDAHNGNRLAIIRLYQYGSHSLTFRPDGTALFMVRREGRGFNANTPLVWTIADIPSGDIELVNHDENTCGGFLPSRLSAGDVGRVLPDVDVVNLRSQPSSSSTSLLQITGNESFSVIDGPQCEFGAAWWQVQFADTVGWVAEGVADAYFLAPMPTQPETPRFAGNISEIVGTRVVQSIHPSPDGTRIAVIDDFGVWIYDLNDLNISPSLLYMPGQNITASTWSNDNSLIAVATATDSSTDDGVVWIWDATTQTLITRQTQSAPVRAMALSPNNELLAISTNDRFYLWHVTNAYDYRILQDAGLMPTELVFNPDGRHLLHIFSEYSGVVWDITTGRPAQGMSIEVGGTNHTAGDPTFLNPVLSLDGLTIASHVGDTIFLWNGITGVRQQEIPLVAAGDPGYSIGITEMAFSPDGNWLATGGDKLRLWDMTFSSPTTLRHEFITSVPTRNVQFSLDGQYVLASNNDQTEVWSMSTFEHVVSLAAGNGIFSYDNQIITYSTEGLSIWDLDGSLVRQLHSTESD